MTLGVLTITFNAAEYLPPFLACCLAQLPGDFRLLVIDNASSDASAELVAQVADPRVELIVNVENIGYAAACNQGLRHLARGGVEEILFINNDTEFDDTLFATLSARRGEHGADAITPRITYFDDPTRDWYTGGRFVLWKGFQGVHFAPPRQHDTLSETANWTDTAPGCCVLIGLDTFKRIGLFDPAYFVYFEDVDFFLRMRRAGLRLLCLPDTVIAHKISLATGGSQSDFSIRYYQRNQIYTLRKHFSSLVVWSQLALLWAKATMRRLLKRDDARQYRLRLHAMREGLALPLPPADGSAGFMSL